MIGFNKTCRGASHIKIDKVCQDFSLSDITPELSIALVSDGHGGERYFRSHIGSELACKVSLEQIRRFVKLLPTDFFDGVPFTQYGVKGECSGTPSKRHIEVLKRLGDSIIAKWICEIEQHAKKNPITDSELESVPKEYIADLNDTNRLAKVYGCTLMGYIQTPSYWFAFQIGDGKLFSFHKETGPKEPVLWDEACFLNRTTSLCDSNASEEFRFTYEGDGGFPYAVFLGSDGLDDSFGEDKNLINFYIQVLKLAFRDGRDKVLEVLDSDLPLLSQRGSQDDMSIATVYNEGFSEEALKELIGWQLSSLTGDLNQNKSRIHRFHKERKALYDFRSSTEKAEIDYNYALKEINNAIENRKKLIERYNNLAKELDSEKPKLFIDDIPYEKVVPQEEPTTDEKQTIGDAGSETETAKEHKEKNSSIQLRNILKKQKKQFNRRFQKNKKKRKRRK